MRNDVLLWGMWPGTGLLITSGLAALVLRWDVLKRTFTKLSAGGSDATSFPLSWTVVGIVISGVALIIVQKVSLGLDVWMTVTAMLLSLPLMLVGLRVLGETNWGPISQLSNTMQAIFGVLAPGHLTANMLASGTTGTIAVESEALMQDFKAGYMIGSTPKYLTIMQIIATPVGAAAVSWMYPLLRETYGIVGETRGADLAHFAGGGPASPRFSRAGSARCRRAPSRRCSSRRCSASCSPSWSSGRSGGCRRRPASGSG